MDDRSIHELSSAVKDLTRHVANIDASLHRIAAADGLKLELGVHSKLDEIIKKLR